MASIITKKHGYLSHKLTYFMSLEDENDNVPPKLRKIWSEQKRNTEFSPYPISANGDLGSMAVDLTKISILEPEYSYYSFHRSIIPDYFINSLKAGEVSIPEVNQQFQPTNDDIHVISTNSFAKGYVGCIFQLETAIFRLDKLYLLAFQEFLRQLAKESSGYARSIDDYVSKRFDREQVVDWIGLPFREVLVECYLSFINPHDDYQLDLLEKRFFLIFERLIDQYASSVVYMIPSFVALVQDLLQDQITITIMTNFPRYIAMRLLMISGLSRFLEGKLPIEHLIAPRRDVFAIDFRKHPSLSRPASPSSRGSSLRDLKDKAMFNYLYNPQYGPHYQSKQYAYACAIMRKHSGLTIVFDRNYEHITLCKKLGMACIGLKDDDEENKVIAMEEDEAVGTRSRFARIRETSSAQFTWKLRGTDYQINNYSEITTERIYQLMRRYVNWINGPALQRQEALAKPRQPSSNNNRRSFLPYRNELPPTVLAEVERIESLRREKRKRMSNQSKTEEEIASDVLFQDHAEKDTIERNLFPDLRNLVKKLQKTSEDYFQNSQKREEKNLGKAFKSFQFSLSNLFDKSSTPQPQCQMDDIKVEEEDWLELLPDDDDGKKR